MIDWLKAAHKKVTGLLYWPMRQIENLWVRALLTWIGHTIIVMGVFFYLLGYLAGGLLFSNVLGAAIGGWLGVSIYIARETLKWPPKRPDIDRYLDAEVPFTAAWWALYWLTQ